MDKYGYIGIETLLNYCENSKEHAVTPNEFMRMNRVRMVEPHWILVRDRLPEDDTEVIVSCTDDSGDSEFSYTTTGWHYKGIWVVGNERSYFVRAWMPLPEPYKGE